MSSPAPTSLLSRELTKSGFHSRVVPSRPTVTTRSSDPGWPADKRLSQRGEVGEKGTRQWGREGS